MKTRVSPTSLRDHVGTLLRDNRLVTAAEILLVPLFLVLQALGPLPTATIPLIIIGWLSLWLRRSGWRHVGMSRPAHWWRTVLIGIGVGVAYQFLDIVIIAPLLRQITGEPLDLSQFAPVRNNFTILVIYLVISWTLAAFGEEMVFRGYVLNRLTDLFGHSKPGWILSLMVSTLLFGFAHGYQGITGVLDTILAGMLLGALYLASQRNLWQPVIAHGVIDTVGFTLIFLGLYP